MGAIAELEGRLRRRMVQTNGRKLFAVECGPAEGPLVVLLHGFPELWYGWRRQILPLAEAGYRVLVPDQCGYHLSDKPRPLREYRIDRLAADVVGMIDEAGREDAWVVGHDWGGIVAWAVALLHRDRVRGLAVLNAPHPAVFRRRLLRDPSQLRRSAYIFWFQLPLLPEWWLRRRDFRLLRRTLLRTSRKGTFSAEDLEAYARAWSVPGALTGMLSWYRALRLPLRLPAGPRVRVPTLLIWGARDAFLGRDLAEASAALCERVRLAIIEEASHWVQHEEPERVNGLLLRFLAARDESSGDTSRAPMERAQ